MTDFPRLIEYAFPLKQTSLDSVHEKNVRHGHISTLHIWPARRPLAACRAALIATLLPDPGDPEKRRELCEKIAGKVVKKTERKKMPGGQVVERVKEETEGGILHWGRETENAETLEWFRQEIRKAYGGRAPKVLDPFAGGGAIPLEAMRLGCEATAVDINPVAWFILKCTLEYPQKLAGQKRPLPDFAVADREFMTDYLKAKGFSAARIAKTLATLGHAKGGQGALELRYEGEDDILHADLAWHVRAWGRWVLARARKELAPYYPTYAEFEPIKKGELAYEPQPMRLVPLTDDGTPDIDALNVEFTAEYLADKRNPRWVVKPTVAYLWARTVTCKNCRATVPLLKTRWLCKKANKRIVLRMEPNADRTGIVFAVDSIVPAQGGNAAQRREHDKRIGAGTMSRAGAKCPCCGTIMTMEDIRLEGQASRLRTTPTAVIVDGEKGKEYRLPTEHEYECAANVDSAFDRLIADLPYGAPTEPTPAGGGRGAGRAFSVQGYGMMRWCDMFISRQVAALACFARAIRAAVDMLGRDSADAEPILGYLYASLARLADRNSVLCTWQVGADKIGHTFARFALPITWDFVEVMPWADSSGGYGQAVDWVALVASHLQAAAAGSAIVLRQSATQLVDGEFDLVLTDPPYYDAIPYSDLMDFFYVWLKRVTCGLSSDVDTVCSSSLSPKWDHAANDGELIDDDSRHGGDQRKSKAVYEAGMARAFQAVFSVLKPNGRLVIVFANKQPDAWETLVTAIVRAGFIVDGSWPIMTERIARTRSLTSAALASSVWLICKKRSPAARSGWDNQVLEEMRTKIAVKLREFWDAGIRGPDFVWAATGPAMEAYSKHPVVRKANEPNATMGVTEFLTHVRRMVVDYVVGQVLTGERGGEGDMAAADRLDEVTAYYLLHRHDFGVDEAPVGACILYATACGLSDADLDKTWDILVHAGGDATGSAEDEADSDESESEESDAEPSEEGGSGGNKVKLKAWNQRRGKSMGYEAPQGKPVPLIDRIHRVMHLWKDGDVHKVDEYLDQHALRRNELFRRVVQSLIELSSNSERALLESISNHVGAKGARRDDSQRNLPGIGDAETEGHGDAGSEE